jgi:MFS family permease
MQTVAISWLMATVPTSDLMVALEQASSNLPAFILSIFARGSRRQLQPSKSHVRRPMPNGNSIRDATASVVLGFIAPWMIFGFSFLIASGAALNDTAWQASVGDIVDRREVPAAVTLLSIGFNTARTVGPALAAS